MKGDPDVEEFANTLLIEAGMELERLMLLKLLYFTVLVCTS